MHGILLIDKPGGISSGDVVKSVKRLTKPFKVGHSGTLDPSATGLLVVLIGSATRILDYLDENPKGYLMSVLLGEETDTCDKEGQIIGGSDASGITKDIIVSSLEQFSGVIDQVPPHFSAIKKNGVPLYKLARKGIYPELSSRKIEIFALNLLDWDPPFLSLSLSCSKGTYARSVARDLGRKLGVGGRLEALRRIQNGQFNVADSVKLDQILEGGLDKIQAQLMSVQDALRHIPTVLVPHSDFQKLSTGVSIRLPGTTFPRQPELVYKIFSSDESKMILIALEQKQLQISVKPIKVIDLS
jgi:tRNA pseudouridine55 synthase